MKTQWIYNYLLIFFIITTGCSGNKQKKGSDSFIDTSKTIEINLHMVSNGIHHYTKFYEIPGRGTLVIHEGTVGNTGRSYEVEKEDRATLMEWANDHYLKLTEKGYQKIDPGAYTSMILQFDTTQFSEINEEVLIILYDIIDRSLKQTGNGGCSNYDVGTTGVNYFATVLDAPAATQTLLNVLEEEDFTPSIIATEKAETTTILYPADFQGEFSYL